MSEHGVDSDGSIHYFEEPLLPEWLYPCTIDDIRSRIALLPSADTAGIWSVGLRTSTRKDCNSEGHYFFGKRARIELYSYPADLRFKLMSHTKLARLRLRPTRCTWSVKWWEYSKAPVVKQRGTIARPAVIILVKRC